MASFTSNYGSVYKHIKNKIFFSDTNPFIYKSWNKEFTFVNILGARNYLLDTHMTDFSSYFIQFKLVLFFLKKGCQQIKQSKILLIGKSGFDVELFNNSLLKEMKINSFIYCLNNTRWYPGFFSNPLTSHFYFEFTDYSKHTSFDSIQKKTKRISNKFDQFFNGFFRNPTVVVMLDAMRSVFPGNDVYTKTIPAICLSNTESFNFGFSGVYYTIPFPKEQVYINHFFFLLCHILQTLHVEYKIALFRSLQNKQEHVNSVLFRNLDMNYTILYKRIFLNLWPFIKNKKISYLQRVHNYLIEAKSIFSGHILASLLYTIWKCQGLLKKQSSVLTLFKKGTMTSSILKLIRMLKSLNVTIFKKKSSSILSTTKLRMYQSLSQIQFNQWHKKFKTKTWLYKQQLTKKKKRTLIYQRQKKNLLKK